MLYNVRGPSPGRARWKPILLSLLWLALPIADAVGQDESGFIQGKTYVIQLSPSAPDKASLEATVGPWLQQQFDQASGMLDHVRTRTYPVQGFKDRAWYYVFFDPTRQTKDDLLHDNDLLVWFFHGHHVQVQPIEMLLSPSEALPLNAGMLKER